MTSKLCGMSCSWLRKQRYLREIFSYGTSENPSGCLRIELGNKNLEPVGVIHDHGYSANHIILEYLVQSIQLFLCHPNDEVRPRLIRILLSSFIEEYEI